MNDKSKLSKTIDKKEKQFHKAELEVGAWNNGKYKTSTNAKASAIFVKTLRNEIYKLKQELESLDE